MKKYLSILFASLILVSGMHLTIATHFCGGVIAGTKISFTGKFATCGMENPDSTIPIQGNHFETHCCDNDVLAYSVDNNFAPSTSVVIEFFKSVSQDLTIPVSISYQSFINIRSIAINVFPPGTLMANSVSLVDICVFRI